MPSSKCLLLLCVTAFLLFCFINKAECRRYRIKRSVDKGTTDYVKVFSAYLGEIPMTSDIRRMEKNLPSDKKKKIYYLKKSQKYAMWSAGDEGEAKGGGAKAPLPILPPKKHPATPKPPPKKPPTTPKPPSKSPTTPKPPPKKPITPKPIPVVPPTTPHPTEKKSSKPKPPVTPKPVVLKTAVPIKNIPKVKTVVKPYECPKEVDVSPAVMIYVHGFQTIGKVDVKRMEKLGFIMGHTAVSGKGNQKKDALQVTFLRPVNIRAIELPGKHNIVKIALSYKQGFKWVDLKTPENKLEMLDFTDDDEVDVHLPPIKLLRIYPQMFNGPKPILHGVKFTGCY